MDAVRTTCSFWTHSSATVKTHFCSAACSTCFTSPLPRSIWHCPLWLHGKSSLPLFPCLLVTPQTTPLIPLPAHSVAHFCIRVYVSSLLRWYRHYWQTWHKHDLSSFFFHLLYCIFKINKTFLGFFLWLAALLPYQYCKLSQSGFGSEPIRLAWVKLLDCWSHSSFFDYQQH